MTETRTALRSRILVAAFAFFGLLVAGRFLTAVLPLSGTAVELLQSDAVYEIVITGCALLAVARAVLIRHERLAWSAIAAGLVAWAIGDLYFVLAGVGESASYPSLADAFFIACYPTIALGVVLLARNRVRSYRHFLWLDCAIGVMALTALGIALLASPAKEIGEATGVAYAPTIAYPICDVTVLVFIVGGAVFGGWRLRQEWLLLAAGMIATGIADAAWALDLALGDASFSASVDALWPLSTLLIAAAAWRSAEFGSSITPEPARPTLIAMPALLALAALGVLLTDHFHRVPAIALVLAAAAIVGVIVRLVFSLREVRAAYEERLRVAERQNHAQRLQSLGELAGGVAHDFNNLLTVIGNTTEFALEDIGDPNALKEDLAEIRAATARGAELNRRLLSFSRSSEVGFVDVGATVRSIECLLTRALGESNPLELALSAQACEVLLPCGALDQILMNLVVNARDAMPGGGQVTIGTALVPSSDGLPRVRIEVSDTGVGMPADVREQMFEPFFSTKPADRGTGLGLSTVYGIVTEAGGHIDVRSEPGLGTTIGIYFPSGEGAASVSRATRSPVVAQA